MAEHVEAEEPEQRLHLDALQAVRAAGEPGVAVGELAQHEGDAERDHDAGEIGAAQDEEAGREPEQHGGGTRREQSRERLGDDGVLGEEPRRVGAEAEEGGVPQRDDAGIAQDQIEREGEKAEDGDLGQDEVLAGQQVDGGERGEPEDHLERMPARTPGEPGADLGGERPLAHLALPRANRPCGRRISTTIMML